MVYAQLLLQFLQIQLCLYRFVQLQFVTYFLVLTLFPAVVRYPEILVVVGAIFKEIHFIRPHSKMNVQNSFLRFALFFSLCRNVIIDLIHSHIEFGWVNIGDGRGKELINNKLSRVDSDVSEFLEPS